MRDLRLEYGFDGRKGTVSGKVVRPSGEEESFSRIPFSKMISSLSEELREHAVDHVLLLRVDVPHSLVYQLDSETVLLIKNDPVLAIRVMSHDMRPSASEFQKKRETTAVATPPLYACVDFLSRTLGDNVYVAVRRKETVQLECPGCGFWSTTLPFRFVCKKKCGLEVPVRLFSKWAAVAVRDLLPLTPAFYLPRAWNTDPPWITREQLAEKYETYKKEKEQCLERLGML